MSKPSRIRRAMKHIQAICDRQIKKAGPPKPKACQDCLDLGVVFYPHVKGGRTSWYTFRCHCDHPASVGTYRETKGGSDITGPRRWSREIPLYTEFYFKDGRPMTRDDVFNTDERHTYETAMLAQKEKDE